jgi:hypothetical protein
VVMLAMHDSNKYIFSISNYSTISPMIVITFV